VVEKHFTAGLRRATHIYVDNKTLAGISERTLQQASTGTPTSQGLLPVFSIVELIKRTKLWRQYWVRYLTGKILYNVATWVFYISCNELRIFLLLPADRRFVPVGAFCGNTVSLIETKTCKPSRSKGAYYDWSISDVPGL